MQEFRKELRQAAMWREAECLKKNFERRKEDKRRKEREEKGKKGEMEDRRKK